MTPESTVSSSLLIKKSIHVAASPERAFDVFTKQMKSWWPLVSHHIGKADAVDAIMEPRVGGRWYEKGVDGSECLWGHVRAWEPSTRLVLSWEISADWKHDEKLDTEVEVRFTKEANGTRVDLEHRLIENYGTRAVEMKGVLDSEGGWTQLLGAFAKQLEQS